MIELYKELEQRSPSEDPIVLARRTNERRIESLEQLSTEITALEGMEKSGKYDAELVERAARIVAAEHAGLVEDMRIEMEALKQVLSEEDSDA